MTTTINPKHRGPLIVEGDFELYDHQGNRIDKPERRKVMLCRCGASKKTPLCDGSHNRAGFNPEAEREE